VKCFAILWADLDRQKLIDFIDKIPEVRNWRAVSGTLFMITEKNENWLADKVHGEFPDLIFLIAPINLSDVQGYEDTETWAFIQNPKPVGSK
jgi:hypothetical protein